MEDGSQSESVIRRNSNERTQQILALKTENQTLSQNFQELNTKYLVLEEKEKKQVEELNAKDYQLAAKDKQINGLKKQTSPLNINTSQTPINEPLNNKNEQPNILKQHLEQIEQAIKEKVPKTWLNVTTIIFVVLGGVAGTIWNAYQKNKINQNLDEMLELVKENTVKK